LYKDLDKNSNKKDRKRVRIEIICDATQVNVKVGMAVSSPFRIQIARRSGVRAKAVPQ